MPVIVRELILRIKAEQPERPGRVERMDSTLNPDNRQGSDDDELLREAVAETLRVLREKKER